MFNIEVLLSCMFEDGKDIIHRSNLDGIQTLVINQCDNEDISIDGFHRVINTTTRGLSVSRNMALNNANGDICIIADNDESFTDNLQNIVSGAYNYFPDADLIIFKLENKACKLGNKARRLHYLDLFRVASWQITFRKTSIMNHFHFDEKLGAGTGNGAGEETKFLLECQKSGKKIYFYPVSLGTMCEGESTWFKGFTEEYFYKRGKTDSYILGRFCATMYAIYFIITKRGLYCKNISMGKAFLTYINGIKESM